MTTIVFPGQGSQFLGMAKDFHDNFNIAKQSFEEIEDYTQINIRKIIFNDIENKLNLTQFTQICIFAASYSIFKSFLSKSDLNLKNINLMMGHSLGEYTALACSNKISLKECSNILKHRGELMNNAIEPNVTGMVALIGLSNDDIYQLINKNELDLEIANEIQIISNYDAKLYNDSLSIKKNLQKQMANKVNWTKSIKKLEELGENKIIEIGPNKVLSGLINRISKNFDIISINTISDL